MARQRNYSKRILRPQDGQELARAIKHEMKRHGNVCDLSHIDVSTVTDFSELFLDSPFNGDISRWDMSNAQILYRMFENSHFTGDISEWDVSSAINMKQMFGKAQFNGDLSRWDVSNVRDFKQIFYGAAFQGDITAWSIHPEAIILSMYSLNQLRVDVFPTLLHWRLAEINLDNVSPALGEHYTKHADLVLSIVSDPVERAYWIHEQWCQAQAQGFAPQETYAVGADFFEFQSAP